MDTPIKNVKNMTIKEKVDLLGKLLEQLLEAINALEGQLSDILVPEAQTGIANQQDKSISPTSLLSSYLDHRLEAAETAISRIRSIQERVNL